MSSTDTQHSESQDDGLQEGASVPVVREELEVPAVGEEQEAPTAPETQPASGMREHQYAGTPFSVSARRPPPAKGQANKQHRDRAGR